ncbi:class I SAM-dependent methyltransferase [Chlorogloeopsis fritschii PCC 9212]|uniref:SAM-dependent methyltransferase n=1 Tax=Chlorogloeopsis fritschii PCC 6912 TaxID=211165 RepID=A0A433MZH9_CHLFR|nr:class I SAM-dependent methyltransferase [Chlorogloeopsis fritschii]RUR73910.1 SAM-dependent methyltransferase [Chlorogloeopsis fritschii PCC 6912]
MSESKHYKPENEDFERKWLAYYQAVEGRPPRDTLLTALDSFDKENIGTSKPYFAVDLGCGEGRDTVELLRRGWRVLAIDGQQEAITRLLNHPDIDSQLLQTRVLRFENLTLPESVDLVNASFSLPFCPPGSFPKLWKVIVTSLRSGGRFAGQLFGERDSWAIYTSITHHTRKQVEQMLEGFEIEILNEEDHPGKTALGEEKHWHIFHVVARKL